jgi:hypothetical protein
MDRRCETGEVREQEPLFIAPSSGLGLVGLILLAEAVITGVIVLAFALSGEDPVEAVVVIAVTFAVITALIYLILPRRFELHSDRLDMVFPIGRWRIPLNTIASVEPARWWQPYAAWGFRFATNPSHAIYITRRDASLFRRPNIVISPDGRDAFLAAMREAMAQHGSAAPCAHL